MRNLMTTDIFAACRLISKMGIRDEIREVARQAELNRQYTETDEPIIELIEEEVTE